MLLATATGRGQIAHYTVLFPSQITAGTYAGDIDIFSSGFGGDGTVDGDAAQPRAVSSQSYAEIDPVAVADHFGGFYLVYTVQHNDSAHKGDRDILMRHLDRSGADTWGDSTNRIVVIAQTKFIEEHPRIQPLDDGTMMVFYQVRYGPTPSADVDIAAIRVSADGHMQWQNGIWVANSKRQEYLRGTVSDGRGGAIAIIETVARHDSAITGSDILAQHIDGSGTAGWKDSREPVKVAGSSHLERNPAAVSDGNGGVYVAYEVEYTAGARAGDVDILAQHLSSVGTREWVNEAQPPIVSSNPKAKEEKPVIVADSTGITVAFEISFLREKPKGLARIIGMQHLDTSAKARWNSGKKSILINLKREYLESPQLIPDHLGGNYLIFEALDTLTNNRDIYGQRIDGVGEQIWGDADQPQPIFNSLDSEHDAQAIVDSADGSIVVIAQRTSMADSTRGYSDIIAHRFSQDGVSPWEKLLTPIAVAHGAFMMGKPVMIRTE